MLEIKKIPSLSLVKSVVRNNLTKPMSKGSVYVFVSPTYDKMYGVVKKYISTNVKTRFNVFGVRTAYHPNNAFFFMNGTNKRRVVNYRKEFTANIKTNVPILNLIKCDPESLGGLNVVDFSSAMVAEVSSGYNREDKPEKAWVYILTEFRKTFRFETEFPDKKDNEEFKQFSEGKKYSEAIMVFDLHYFDIPKLSDMNVARAAKYPDMLRNFLYFLQYESKKYAHLLHDISFLFTSPNGIVKFKVDKDMNIVESIQSNLVQWSASEHRAYNVTNYNGDSDILEAKKPDESVNDAVHTLVLLINKLNVGDDTSDKDLEDKLKEVNPVVVTSTAETEAKDQEDVKLLRSTEDLTIELPEEIQNELSDVLSNDDVHLSNATSAVLDAVNKSRQERITRLSTPKQQTAINKMYKADIDVNINGKNTKVSLMDTLNNPVDMSIPKISIPIHSEQGYDENGFMKFTEAYNEKLLIPHIAAAASAFKDAEIPVYVESMSITDTSDKYKEVNTVSTRFSDEDGNKFTVTVDIPKMYKGNRIKTGSSEKILIGQLTYLPILKVDDAVIITTNYNKVFMERKYGNGLTPQGNKMLRALKAMLSAKETQDFSIGDHSASNLKSNIMSEEMKELSSVIGSIDTRADKTKINEISDGEVVIYFKSTDIETLNTSVNVSDDNYVAIGMIGDAERSLILLNLETARIYVPGMIDHETIYNAILILSDHSKIGIRPYYDAIKTVNKLTSTYVKLMNEWVPLIYILMYTDGLYSIIERTGVKHEIIHSSEKARRANKDTEILIKLEDSSIYIDVQDAAMSMLFYPLANEDLSMYKLSDLENPDFTSAVLSTVTGNNLSFPIQMSVFKSCFIDPYTKNILESLNQPTEFTSVMLYANNLLASNEVMEELSLNSCRIRYAEMIQAVYYKELSNAYSEYAIKKSRGAKNPKMSLPKERIITSVTALPNTEEYSKLNPYMENIKRWSCNYKGHMGKNLPRSYTWEGRSYHSSYVGSIGLPTAFSANIGINKQLTIDPCIDNLSGMFNVIDDPDTLKSKQIVTSTEAITTGSASRSDAPRDAMNQAQKSAIIAINKMDTAYYTNTFDKALPYMSEDFVVKSKNKGKITKITARYVQITYADGSIDSVKLRRIYKNSAKGKYVTCHMTPSVRLNQTVGAGDIVAHDANFFKYNGMEIVATMGSMVNVLWKSESLNYEDSIIISESASEYFMVKAVKRIACKVNKKSKIINALTLDDYVDAETALVEYVSGSDDDLLSQFLDASELSELDKKSKTAHKAGIVTNINLTYAFDPSTASNTVKKLIERVKKDVLSMQEEAILLESTDDFDKREHTDLPQEVKAPHKLNGDEIEKDEMLIEYFIEYYDFTGKGDKGSQTTALKGIVAEVRPDELMPIGVDSGRRYDVICSQYSPGARKTFDVNVDMLANALMEKLNKDAREVFGIK